MLKLSTTICREIKWNPLGLDEDSSSDGQNDTRNHIHIEDYFNSIRDIKKRVHAKRNRS